MKVLLVDDEMLNTLILGKKLQNEGHTIVKAANGIEAVEATCNPSDGKIPDLILMDLMMPKMDGWEATKKIKENPETKDVPVIAVTAQNDVADKVIEFGFDGFCAKPVDLGRLMDMVKKMEK